MGDRALKRRAAIFLDRDGVLNRALPAADGVPRPPTSLADTELLPRVPQACARLRRLGFLLIGVTNQPDVARGLQTRSVVEEINRWVARETGLTEFRTCYHDDSDQCSCRKPQPGLLTSAAHDHGVDLEVSYMVGDRWRDVEAGRRAGCATIFIDSGHAEPLVSAPTHRAKSLWEACDWIEAREGRV